MVRRQSTCINTVYQRDLLVYNVHCDLDRPPRDETTQVHLAWSRGSLSGCDQHWIADFLGTTRLRTTTIPLRTSHPRNAYVVSAYCVCLTFNSLRISVRSLFTSSLHRHLGNRSISNPTHRLQGCSWLKLLAQAVVAQELPSS